MSECLTTKQLKTVLNLIWKDRSKWFTIGIQLNLEESELRAIRTNCHNVEDSFTEMISLWLHQVDPKPTWTALVDALDSPPVDSKGTAKAIKEQYILKEPHSDSEKDDHDLSEGVNELTPIEPPRKVACELEKLDRWFSKLA